MIAFAAPGAGAKRRGYGAFCAVLTSARPATRAPKRRVLSHAVFGRRVFPMRLVGVTFPDGGSPRGSARKLAEGGIRLPFLVSQDHPALAVWKRARFGSSFRHAPPFRVATLKARRAVR